MCMGIGMPSELGVVEGPQLCTDGSMGRILSGHGVPCAGKGSYSLPKAQWLRG